MAGKADFTDQEWEAMQRGVAGSGMLLSLADQDFTDMFGETSALAKYLARQREEGPTQLVRELAGLRGTGFGLTASPQEVEEGTFGSIAAARRALEEKAPEEVAAYRDLVLGAAEAVAEAKGGVAESESAALNRIREALGPEEAAQDTEGASEELDT